MVTSSMIVDKNGKESCLKWFLEKPKINKKGKTVSNGCWLDLVVNVFE